MGYGGGVAGWNIVKPNTTNMDYRNVVHNGVRTLRQSQRLDISHLQFLVECHES